MLCVNIDDAPPAFLYIYYGFIIFVIIKAICMYIKYK